MQTSDAKRHFYPMLLQKLTPKNLITNMSTTVLRIMLMHHLKRQIMGHEVMITISDGKLDFEPWEQIFNGESDGMKKMRV